MNYKETLFFVAKCLTISLEEKNRIEIEQQLKNTEIDWDNVVKLSTAQYVFPALYINLKRANFLNYLPEELVNYMVHITDLNRERNLQIIAQAKEVNTLLLANNSTPIFIKGTGNLLEGLYEDIGERMVGDIDFLIVEKESINAFNLLRKNGYNYKENIERIAGRHLPRLTHKNNIAALEIHTEILRNKYIKEFNFYSLESELKLKQEFCTPNTKHQLVVTILSKQINDYGYQLKLINLRSFYDVFLLSKKTDTLNSIKEFPSLFLQTNSFLALASAVFNNPNSIKYEKTKTARTYTIKGIVKMKSKKRVTQFKIFLGIKISIFLKALNNKKDRSYILSRIKSRLTI